MNEKDEETESVHDDFDKASRVNFREYPSTALLVVGALSSGLALMLYKWLGKKNVEKPITHDNAGDDKQEAP
jgi:hypothetical protein